MSCGQSDVCELHSKCHRTPTTIFKKIGVDPVITTLGQAPVYDQYEASEAYVGWYYSIDDLYTLGVKHIEVINPPWKQRDLSQTVRFFKVSVSDSE